MPRAVTTLSSALTILALTALPAFAAEKGPAVTGSAMGVLIGLPIGLILGVIMTWHAYNASTYGESEAQYEYAHDIREGVGGHEPHEEEVGAAVPAEEEPAGSA
ncbi:MAG: hypothetical protein M3133_01845 [Actinomycetota bacterium]|nr:hypothetical protein [Actinomycetota bacterium]